MQFFSTVSSRHTADEAVTEVVDLATAAMGGKIDVAFAFLTGHFVDDAVAIVESLWLELDAQALVGCSGEGVIGADREVERAPGLALLVGRLPDVRLHPFHLSGEKVWREILTDPVALRSRIGYTEQARAIIGFGDPFTSPMNQLLPALDAAAPGAPLIGGMASSAQQPGENVLFRNDGVHDEGLVGITLSGPIEVDTIVSQGCRPIGRPLVITRAHDNVIEQLGGKPALQALQEIAESLDDAEREQLGTGLFVGRAISEYKDRFGRGDFLVRNVMGIDQDNGAVAVADYMKTGQTVQFHVRDAATADEDLRLLLDGQKLNASAAGGLLFSCNGRGTRMFPSECHDIGATRSAMPHTPVAGFFAAGELGPVGGKNFMHGHTASFALFRPRSTAVAKS